MQLGLGLGLGTRPNGPGNLAPTDIDWPNEYVPVDVLQLGGENLQLGGESLTLGDE